MKKIGWNCVKNASLSRLLTRSSHHFPKRNWNSSISVVSAFYLNLQSILVFMKTPRTHAQHADNPVARSFEFIQIILSRIREIASGAPTQSTSVPYTDWTEAIPSLFAFKFPPRKRIASNVDGFTFLPSALVVAEIFAPFLAVGISAQIW